MLRCEERNDGHQILIELFPSAQRPRRGCDRRSAFKHTLVQLPIRSANRSRLISTDLFMSTLLSGAGLYVVTIYLFAYLKRFPESIHPRGLTLRL